MRAAQGRVKRGAAGSLIAAVLVMGIVVVPSGASNLVKHRFTAPLQGGANNAGLELNAYYKHGVPDFVTSLEWHNVSCGGPYAGTQHWTVPVNDHLKFHKKHAIVHGYTGSTVKITGKFTKKKNGKYRLAGTFAVSPTPGCPNGTGTLDYKSG
jgi:hypothetical protein